MKDADLFPLDPAVPFGSAAPFETAPLDLVGGKGRSLCRLIAAGFPVPPGFVISTAVYRGFVDRHGLGPRIEALARPAVVDGAVSFDAASAAIQALFNAHPLDDAERSALLAAYDRLGGSSAVAVRSSANAEDLPGLSFAGQQETKLNVRGGDAVATAIVDCWASLWNAQAMRYRHQMGVDQRSVAMAVVVQTMVPADVAGILFTANPATGDRDEIVVNASPGLGEAIVSGEVTPDTYVVDRETLQVKHVVVGAKEVMTVDDGVQGTRVTAVPASLRGQRAIDDDQVAALCALALRVESAFDGVPQDIEWAVADGALHLLQARPITNLLGPPPRDVTWSEIPGAQLLKRQVAENMPDPLSPLFEDLYLRALFDTQTWPEGWPWEGRLTKNYAKNFVVTTVNGYAYQPIYEGSAAEWKAVMDKHRADQRARSRYGNLRRAFTQGQFFIDDMKGGRLHFVYLIVRAFRAVRRYPAILKWEREQLPAYLAAIDRWQGADPRDLDTADLLTGMEALTRAEAAYWHALRSVIGTAKITDGGLQTFLETHAPEKGWISGTFLSGFPSRTLDAERELRGIAATIRDDPRLYELVVVTPAARVLDALQRHPAGRAVRDSIDRYLDEFGRQVFNLDFVEAALAEAPLPFVVGLQRMVVDAGYDLDVRQREVARTRRTAMRGALRYFRGRRRLSFLRAYWTARANYPAREEALFFMGRAWSVFRPLALELGRRLRGIGTLDENGDVFFLTSAALRDAIESLDAGQSLPQLGEQARSERALRTLRFRMDQPAAIPPIANESPFATIRDHDVDVAGALRGFAVSPGTVTGVASVIMSPQDFGQMKPGTILVCPLTTPAWTQLFPHAIGLVTDIGSILAHGSIVAREYGIPAVLGVGDATQRIRSGDTITVDGGRGTVAILDAKPLEEEAVRRA